MEAHEFQISPPGGNDIKTFCRTASLYPLSPEPLFADRQASFQHAGSPFGNEVSQVQQHCMNSIEIHYMQPLTGIFSKRSENAKIPHGTMLSKFLKDLFATYGREFQKYEIDPSRAPLVILLNGKTVPSKGLDIELKDQDSLVLWMPVAGG